MGVTFFRSCGAKLSISMHPLHAAGPIVFTRFMMALELRVNLLILSSVCEDTLSLNTLISDIG